VCHRISRKLAVLRIAPGAFLAAVFLDAHRPLIYAERPALLVPFCRIDQEPVLPFVVDQRGAIRFIVCRVSHYVAADVEILSEEEAYLSRTIRSVVEHHLAQIHILVEINRIIADQSERKIRVIQRNLGDQRVVRIVHGTLPARGTDPGEPAIHPDTQTARMTVRVVLLPHVWPVEIAQVICGVKVDQK